MPMNLIDRSFTNLGYIGYGDGIDLDKLDNGGNWQFSNFEWNWIINHYDVYQNIIYLF